MGSATTGEKRPAACKLQPQDTWRLPHHRVQGHLGSWKWGGAGMSLGVGGIFTLLGEFSPLSLNTGRLGRRRETKGGCGRGLDPEPGPPRHSLFPGRAPPSQNAQAGEGSSDVGGLGPRSRLWRGPRKVGARSVNFPVPRLGRTAPRDLSPFPLSGCRTPTPGPGSPQPHLGARSGALAPGSAPQPQRRKEESASE